MKSTAPLQNPNWDYTTLTAGLNNVDLTAIPAAKFDAKKVQQAVEAQVSTESNSWDDGDGSLYLFEINFLPNKEDFAADTYSGAFKKVLDLSQTFGGALVTIEGHNAPDLLVILHGIVPNSPLTAKQQKALVALGMSAYAQESKLSMDQIGDAIKTGELAARNTSKRRANAVRAAYIAFAKSKGVTVDESQLVAVGMGATHPKFAIPADEGQWKANMRVVFRVKNVETEMDSFQAPGSK
jgi:hypothetical protein